MTIFRLKTSRVLFSDTLELVCDFTITAFYEHSSSAETNATLFYCQRRLKIKGEYYLQKKASDIFCLKLRQIEDGIEGLTAVALLKPQELTF